MARRMKKHVVDFLNPTSVRQTNSARGRLHPDYAVTLFRKTFGVGLVNYLTQHRLTHAQRLLAITNHKIARIAFKSGFGSLSRFYHIFTRDRKSVV
jgi:transcriptional regulator GlxA family with amidase domain